MKAKMLGLLLAIVLASPLTANAALVISNLVNTQDEYSFDFAGETNVFTPGDLFDAAGSPAGWTYLLGGGGGPLGNSWLFGFGNGLAHEGGGPVLTLGLSGLYGASDSDLVSAMHGTGLDSLSLSMTVEGSGDNWRSASGSFSLVHTSVVPEPATLALLSLGLAGLRFSRRRQ